MTMHSTRVVHVTKDELETKIASILEKYPFFVGMGEGCCTFCVGDDIREARGVEAERAWRELDTARFLLGGDDA